MIYTSIEDMPIYNWFKCIDTKDYSYCSSERKNITEDVLKECEIAFNTCYDEFIYTFGISPELAEIIRIKNKILMLKIDIALTGDKSLENFIEIEEIQLNERLEVKQTKTNTYKVAIEKYLGFRLNEKEVTVKEYYEYLQAIKENHGRATD